MKFKLHFSFLLVLLAALLYNKFGMYVRLF